MTDLASVHQEMLIEAEAEKILLEGKLDGVDRLLRGTREEIEKLQDRVSELANERERWKAEARYWKSAHSNCLEANSMLRSGYRKMREGIQNLLKDSELDW